MAWQGVFRAARGGQVRAQLQRECRPAPWRLSVRCIAFGLRHETSFEVLEVSAVGGEAKLRERSLSGLELQRMTGVHARDLRVLNDRGPEAFRALIQPRGHSAFLLTMGMFRAIVTADRFVMFQATEPARIFARFHLLPIAQSALLPQQILPLLGDEEEEDDEAFEIRCLRAVLAVTQRRLRRRAHCFGPVVERLLDQVCSGDPEQALSELLSVQRVLNELERGCESIVHCIDELLQNDEEMLSLLLTAKRDLPDGSLPASNCHEEVEALLESYHYSFKDVSDRLHLFIRAIEATQRAVQISFESKRTRLLHLNVHISIATVSLASVATVSSIFGMNLLSGLETTPGLFAFATGSSFMLAISVYAINMTFLRTHERTLQKRLQRMAALRATAEKMPLLTDTILSQLELQSQEDRSVNAGSPHMLPEYLDMSPVKKQDAPKDYLNLSDFRRLCQSEAISKDGFPDAEIVKLFHTLDSDQNGRIEHHDVAEFLCIQSSPLSGLGHGVQ